MNLLKYKIAGLNLLIISLISSFDFYTIKTLNASENLNFPKSDYIKTFPKNRFYILGPGDVLFIKVSDNDYLLNTTLIINGEGTANLKRLKRIYLEGLTISELTDILNKEYKKYVKEPNVQITLLQHRPVQVFIDGEVESPGMYKLFPRNIKKLEKNNLINNISNQENNLDPEISVRNETIYLPDLIDALKTSGGINLKADLSRIEVTRKNPISLGGGRIKKEVDLLKTLDRKDSSQNIRIYDGDTIFVPKSKFDSLDKVRKAIKTNINPKYINVYVSGRVSSPGTISISKTASLNEAVLISGGTKVIKGPITFLRYNSEGSNDVRRFNYRNRAKRGSYHNPYLKNGDIIYVGNNLLSATAEVLNEVIAPIIFFRTIED